MRLLLLSAALLLSSGVAVAQSIEETEHAVDCLALTKVAESQQSRPDIAQLKRWESTLSTSEYCKTPEEGVEFRIEEYRSALTSGDEARRSTLRMMVESEAQKCVTGASVTSYEQGV